ncbi:MAG: helix-turn-helix domain-containing protein [Candidatus Marinimicrobia bacterium]|nr:helix-turn-helix domain-containing protein [Candidatus Neomarinimicrobiota bacterium]
MAIRKTTKDKYLQIFALVEQGFAVSEIAEKFNCTQRTVFNAIDWVRKTWPDFSSEDALYLAIKVKEAAIRKYEERWDELRQGIREETIKIKQLAKKQRKNGRNKIEPINTPVTMSTTKKTKYPLGAEIAYARLIRDLHNDVARLRGLLNDIDADGARAVDTAEVTAALAELDGYSGPLPE